MTTKQPDWGFSITAMFCLICLMAMLQWLEYKESKRFREIFNARTEWLCTQHSECAKLLEEARNATP